MASLYPRAIAGSLLPGGRGDTLPDLEVRVHDATLEPERLAAYRDVCGFSRTGALPVTAPHLLAFPLQMSVMTDRSFPFDVLGLVHVANRAELVRPVADGEELDLTVRARDLRDHPRGRQFDLVAEASAGGQEVWRSVSTYLRTGGGDRDGGRDRPRPGTPPQPSEYWEVPDDTGRRYAAVSGDRNPIHLHPLTARPFGFPRAIAHGMWVKARSIAAIESELGDAYAAEVEFKLPLLLPARVAFAVTDAEGSARAISVRDAGSGRPHLSGTVSPRR